jgi:transposase
MIRQMERSAAHLLAKRGQSIRQIAQALGHSPTTIARILREPVDQHPAPRQRRAAVNAYHDLVVRGISEGLSGVRLLELARADPEHPYQGSRSNFGAYVRRLRREHQRQRAVADVPVRFEGLPAEYLQVDWGEIRAFPFTQQAGGRRYFLCCRLKYSRWVFVRFTRDMRQETLFRGLVACCVRLGWVPWVLVFDNMKTVTSGRDQAGAPIWTSGLRQLAAEFGFHPHACDPGAGNQKGSVEALVKWVKGNFLPGRSFTDDQDLAAQLADWLQAANSRPSAATGMPPQTRLPAEAAQGGVLPATAGDYGLFQAGHVSPEALVAVLGNRYSVPVEHVGAPVTVRVHQQRLRIFRDTACIADHARVPDGSLRRVVDLDHFAHLFARKPRAHAMLLREALLALGGPAPRFLSVLSWRCRDRLPEEVRAVHLLATRYATAAVLAAMTRALDAGVASAAALAVLLHQESTSPAAPALPLYGIPAQAEVDRHLSVYEAWVQVDVALPEVG